MHAFKRLVAMSLGLVLVVAGIGILTPAAARADKTQEVKVVNTAAEPVPVTLAAGSDPAHSAVGAQCFIAFYNGEDSCTLAQVPAGRVLVIETLTCGATVVAGSAFTGMRVTMAAPKVSGEPGLVNLNHIIGLVRVATNGPNDYYNLTTPVRMYAQGGFSVSVGANAAAGSHSASCTISGHLVAE